MTARRLQLQALLETFAPNVYFQPPSNVQMEYPCIVYERDRTSTRFAGNKPYARTKGYQVTVIDRNPDSEIPDKIAELPQCLWDRFFVVNNLNHDIFTLFY